MSVVFHCGFTRVAVKESWHKVGSTLIETDPGERWKNYLGVFEEDIQEIFAVERSTYIKKSKAIYSSFRKMNSKSRSQYIEAFSAANWKALPMSQKKQHTLSNCGGCQVHYFAIHTLFPNGETFKPRKLVQDALGKSGLKAQSELKPTQTAIKSAVKHIYSKLNGPFEHIFKVSFAEAQTKVKELNLQKTKDTMTKKRERRERARQEKKKNQDQWAKRDCDVMLGTRQSFSQRLKQRQSLHFESSTEAAMRVGKRKNQENLGERKPKRHSPPPASVHFEKENILKEVKNMKDGEKVIILDKSIGFNGISTKGKSGLRGLKPTSPFSLQSHIDTCTCTYTCTYPTPVRSSTIYTVTIFW